MYTPIFFRNGKTSIAIRLKGHRALSPRVLHNQKKNREIDLLPSAIESKMCFEDAGRNLRPDHHV